MRLPHVRILVEEHGTLAVTVDGQNYPAPGDRSSWVRADLGALLDAVTEDRWRTVRVEISETDGSTFTDIIRAAPRRKQSPACEQADHAESPGGKHKLSKKPRTIRADGFTPGETVALAVVASEAAADEEGTVEVTVPRGRIKAAEIVVLYGRSSGRIQLRGLA